MPGCCEEEAEWFDNHDKGEYWDELEPVDLVVNMAKPKEETLIIRVNKDIKKKLEEVAKGKGITTSTLARILLTEKLQTI